MLREEKILQINKKLENLCEKDLSIIAKVADAFNVIQIISRTDKSLSSITSK